MQPPTPPAPHFASPYARPSMAPSMARRIKRPDGAQIAFFVYGSVSRARFSLPSSEMPQIKDSDYTVGKEEIGQSAGKRPATANDQSREEPQRETAQQLKNPGETNVPLPVLFLHGNGEEHGIFGPQIDAVVERGGIAVGVDSRAQGFSTRGTARLTYELMAEDALAVLDELNIPRAHVVGFSDGAIEALLLARDHPERVASAVVVGANLTPGGVDNTDFPIEQIAEENETWAQWLRSLQKATSQNGNTSEKEATKAGGNNHSSAPVAEDTGNATGIGTPGESRSTAVGQASPIDPDLLMPSAEEARNTADLMRLMMEEPHIPTASLARITCPTAVVAGEFDVIFPRETLAIKHAIPHAELFIAPDCGHSIPKHAPEFLTQVMLHTQSRFSAAR